VARVCSEPDQTLAPPYLDFEGSREADVRLFLAAVTRRFGLDPAVAARARRDERCRPRRDQPEASAP